MNPDGKHCDMMECIALKMYIIGPFPLISTQHGSTRFSDIFHD